LFETDPLAEPFYGLSIVVNFVLELMIFYPLLVVIFLICFLTFLYTVTCYCFLNLVRSLEYQIFWCGPEDNCFRIFTVIKLGLCWGWWV